MSRSIIGIVAIVLGAPAVAGAFAAAGGEFDGSDATRAEFVQALTDSGIDKSTSSCLADAADGHYVVDIDLDVHVRPMLTELYECLGYQGEQAACVGDGFVEVYSEGDADKAAGLTFRRFGEFQQHLNLPQARGFLTVIFDCGGMSKDQAACVVAAMEADHDLPILPELVRANTLSDKESKAVDRAVRSCGGVA